MKGTNFIVLLLFIQGCSTITSDMTHSQKRRYESQFEYSNRLEELNRNFNLTELGIPTSGELLQRKICNPKHISHYEVVDELWKVESINVRKYRQQMVCNQLADNPELEVRRTLVNDERYGSITTYYLTDGFKVLNFATSTCTRHDGNPETPYHCSLNLEP